MLNNGSIETIQLGNDKQILVNSMPHVAVGCRIAAEAMANGTDAQGRDICKKGTPLTGDLTARQTLMTAAGADNCVGVLIHDVPLYEADAIGNGSLLVKGGIILEEIDTDIQALIRATNLMGVNSNITVVTRQ